MTEVQTAIPFAGQLILAALVATIVFCWLARTRSSFDR
jgi:hypothetical protein